MEMQIIARVHSDFPAKFGIPRQSGLVPELKAKVVFEPGFRSREAVRGLEQFSHIWLIWQFSEVPEDTWSPTVRPPRLGGNKRVDAALDCGRYMVSYGAAAAAGRE